MFCLVSECKSWISDLLIREFDSFDPSYISEQLRKVSVNFSKHDSHGHIATNAAMVMCKQLKKPPMELAEIVAQKLKEDRHQEIKSIEVLKPGFINIILSDSFIVQVLKNIWADGQSYGNQPDFGKGEKVNIEFLSANPTGPLHIANARGGVLGDVLSSAMSIMGYSVAREYYINDAGAQVELLGDSLFEQYKIALGLEVDLREDLYKHEALQDLGKQVASENGEKWLASSYDKDGENLLERKEYFKQAAIVGMMDLIKRDLNDLGIHYDSFVSEKTLHDKVAPVINELEAKGFVYEGVLEPPKGSKGQGSKEKQLLFRASKLGDSQDRALKKGDGSWTYFACDIAYHINKLDRGFLRQIDVLGADHGGYIKRLSCALNAYSDGKAQLGGFMYQLVNLLKDGNAFVMSKRSGNFVTLREVLDKLGKGCIRFLMLTRHHDMTLDFDCDKALESSKENPYYYVQYAHVRACSILRKYLGKGANLEALKDQSYVDTIDLSNLSRKEYTCLIMKMASWPSQLKGTVESLEPHRIALYLMDLSSLFHEVWALGNQDQSLRFFDQDLGEQVEADKMLLVACVKSVLAKALSVIGVEPIEEL